MKWQRRTLTSHCVLDIAKKSNKFFTQEQLKKKKELTLQEDTKALRKHDPKS